jgi:hypothetical protein
MYELCMVQVLVHFEIIFIHISAGYGYILKWYLYVLRFQRVKHLQPKQTKNIIYFLYCNCIHTNLFYFNIYIWMRLLPPTCRRVLIKNHVYIPEIETVIGRNRSHDISLCKQRRTGQSGTRDLVTWSTGDYKFRSGLAREPFARCPLNTEEQRAPEGERGRRLAN